MTDNVSIGDERTQVHGDRVRDPLSLGDMPTSVEAATESGFIATGSSSFMSGRVDRYILLSELGQGGFGSVWSAFDVVAGIEVALKMLPPHVGRDARRLEEVRNNFQLVSGLVHSNIVVVRHLHQVEQVDPQVEAALKIRPGDWLVVMDVVAGETLSSYRLRQPRGKIAFARAIDICCGIAAGLDFAHGEGIVHRDIKPSNIMVAKCASDLEANSYDIGANCTVKVLDFGLAARLNPEQQESRISGTRPYMAPEQWRGQLQDGRTDQYALAVLFYEMVGGDVPFAPEFTGTCIDSMRRAVLKNPILPLRELTPEQNEVLLKALSKDPEDRFPNCSTFVAALAGDPASGMATLSRFRDVGESIRSSPLAIRAVEYYLRCLEEEARQQSSVRMQTLQGSFCSESGPELVFTGPGFLSTEEQSIPGQLDLNGRLIYGYLFYIESAQWNGRTYYNADPLFMCDMQYDAESKRFDPVDAQEVTINRNVLRKFEAFAEVSHDEMDAFLAHAGRLDSARECVLHVMETIGLEKNVFLNVGPLPKQFTVNQLLRHAAVFPINTGFYRRTVDELMQISRQWRKDKGGRGPAWELLNGLSENSLSGKWDICPLSVVESNYEQAAATGLSLNNENMLQVVTGPPGTGKSQFILNLIANQTEQGRTVLLASHNNQAVDVVVNRMNDELAQRPFVFRTGNDQKERAFAQELNSAGTVGETELESYDERVSTALSELESLNRDLGTLKKEREKYVRARWEIRKIRKEMSDLTQVHRDIVGLWDWYSEDAHDNFGKEAWETLEKNHGKRQKACRFLFLRLGMWLQLGGDLKTFWSGAKYQAFIQKSLHEGICEQLPKMVSDLLGGEDPTGTASLLYTTIERLTLLGRRYRECRSITDAYDEEGALEAWSRIEKSKTEPSLTRFRGIVLQRHADPDLFTAADHMLRRRPDSFAPDLEYIMKGFPAWATSSLSVGRRIPLQEDLFDLVVIDEASQVDVATILPLLFRARCAVIVGDENQLGPITGLDPALEYQIAQACNLSEEELAPLSHIKSSLYTLAAARASSAGGIVVMLKDHYRCHPHIIGFSNRHFYKQCLRPRTVAAPDDGMFFCPVNGTAEPKWLNKAEADHVCLLIQKLIESGHSPADIGVVSPFRRQVEHIRSRLSCDGYDVAGGKKGITVGTAHTYQGDEREIMIFSLVIGEEMPHGTIRWLHHPLSSSKNLLNVALTRARKRLYVVGNREICLRSGGLLKQLVLYCEAVASEPDES